MRLGKIDAEGVVLGLVPAGDDVQAGSATPQLVDTRQLLGDHYGVVEGGMHRGEHLYMAGMGGEACGPGDGFEDAAVKIGFAAIADPARNGEQKFKAGIVTEARQCEVVVPGVLPALGNFRYGHAAGAIGREDAEFQLVAVKHGAEDGHGVTSPVRLLVFYYG